MKISRKGKYAIASSLYMACNVECDNYVSLNIISEKLGISKIYLEQVFSALKNGNIVSSIKGPQGGYKLNKKINEISMLDILLLTDSNLFETNENIFNTYPEIDLVIKNIITDDIELKIKKYLSSITLDTLLEYYLKYSNENFMYYI